MRRGDHARPAHASGGRPAPRGRKARATEHDPAHDRPNTSYKRPDPTSDLQLLISNPWPPASRLQPPAPRNSRPSRNGLLDCALIHETEGKPARATSAKAQIPQDAATQAAQPPRAQADRPDALPAVPLGAAAAHRLPDLRLLQARERRRRRQGIRISLSAPAASPLAAPRSPRSVVFPLPASRFPLPTSGGAARA